MLRRHPVLPTAAVLGVLAAMLGACDEPTEDVERTPPPLEVDWEAVSLPHAPAPAGRITLRDAVACEGTWYVVGGVLGDDGQTSPAGWTSTDGTTWSPMELRAEAYWAQRAVLSSVACSGDQVRMIGAQSGGAHGNPRVSTWSGPSPGPFSDVAAPFELYGGPSAVNVGRMAAGPHGAGWLIAGNRTSGAAVWWSPTGRDFRLVDDDPALTHDARTTTMAVEAEHDGGGWTVVGQAGIEGRVGRVPAAWTSADGLTWTREEVPVTDGFGSMDRVTRAGEQLLAAGLDSEAFGLWRRAGSAWESVARFGALDPEGHAFAGVTALAEVAGDALASVSDGAQLALWTGPTAQDTGWRQVATPQNPTTTGDHVLTVAAAGSEVLLLADDGEAAGLWRAEWPGG